MTHPYHSREVWVLDLLYKTFKNSFLIILSFSLTNLRRNSLFPLTVLSVKNSINWNGRPHDLSNSCLLYLRLLSYFTSYRAHTRAWAQRNVVIFQKTTSKKRKNWKIDLLTLGFEPPPLLVLLHWMMLRSILRRFWTGNVRGRRFAILIFFKFVILRHEKCQRRKKTGRFFNWVQNRPETGRDGCVRP